MAMGQRIDITELPVQSRNPTEMKGGENTMATIFEGKELNPGVKRIHEIEEAIEKKLNDDGRWAGLQQLPLVEAISRLSSLTSEESDYLGALMGWEPPLYEGVDWNEVPTALLADAAAGKLSTEDLRALYPAPAEG